VKPAGASFFFNHPHRLASPSPLRREKNQMIEEEYGPRIKQEEEF
jgi:hypothetical protein